MYPPGPRDRTAIYAEPARYATPHDLRSIPWRCIGPTQRYTRCLNEHRKSDAARELEEEAKSTPEGIVRNELIILFLQACCCTVHEPRFLDQVMSLDGLVRIYNESFGPAPAVANEDVTSPTGGQSRLGMRLRSQPKSQSQGSFHKYCPHYPTTVAHHLISPEKHKHASIMSGVIYCFNIPSRHGHVKIGFTSGPAAMRIEQWRACYPEASLLHEARVSWPWHVEQAIHLELAALRRHAMCETCSVYHNEWFEVETRAAIEVIKGWTELVNKSSLFDSADGRLSEEWGERVRGLGEHVTAKSLLEIARALGLPSARGISKAFQEEILPKTQINLTKNEWDVADATLTREKEAVIDELPAEGQGEYAGVAPAQAELKVAEDAAAHLTRSGVTIAKVLEAAQEQSLLTVPLAQNDSASTREDIILMALREFSALIQTQYQTRFTEVRTTVEPVTEAVVVQHAPVMLAA